MSTNVVPVRDVLTHLIDQVRQRAAEIDISIVCNRRDSPIPTGDFDRHSLRTEFYSDRELSEVIGNLRRHGLNIINVFDEEAFFRTSIHGQRPNDRMHVLMNFGSARLGPWGKTLIPAVADALGWVATNSNAYSVALARHKFHCAAILDGIGIRSARTWCFSVANGWIGRGVPPQNLDVLIQPAYESASIGVDTESRRTVDLSITQVCADMAMQFRQDVIAREFICGYEVEVPLVCLDAWYPLEPIGITVGGFAQLNDRYLKYEDVLDDAYGFYPAVRELGTECATALQQTAQAVAKALGLRGFSRVDYRVTLDGRAYVTDISASPHFIEHSSFAYAAELAEMDPAALPVLLVGLALHREQML
jgi:D-alanine-D-alanine ligase